MVEWYGYGYWFTVVGYGGGYKITVYGLWFMVYGLRYCHCYGYVFVMEILVTKLRSVPQIEV